ncbi:MAG: 3-deoxy-manno-octulosonate cytidylyltransferase [Nitrospirae bacterium]|nr:MAG: 3-deoxy-manno-octulosonate cytidylyltransferase [Nitrospirota bacterium]
MADTVAHATVAVVIPARYASSRFPGKPLARLGGKPMIQQVYERARAARGVNRVVVATDDARIHDCVIGFGGEAVITGGELRSGSDRVAAVARAIQADIYVNLQGDEIPLAHGFLEDLILPFAQSDADVGTLKQAITEERDLLDPNVVKVITDQTGNALYFSRSPIPYPRDRRAGDSALVPGLHWKHLGLYIYRAAALAHFAKLPSGTLEVTEQLEQLRLLEAGVRIRVWETQHASLRVDTPADLERAEQLLTREEARLGALGEGGCK